ncbi:hypothetical protein PF005_g26734 [Phytophthora fragariae]|uniref:Uncharacterized protein n=1 Tax=Phytophthora fragariae TaxID=53985 RepID=A0A6A4BN87_9STRA|nr:hypothetical protein PF003_g12993 [Phytophthora fragariae]KAE8922456.1 hypothetical protein PF009_g27282 [Phytophthora fragariae]KAE8968656.1 hypothetical protein PF011_g27101 [Phytophthora fragariae]KAE9071015.1 hypothetical protein PF007_g26716 [Phytophthora fragariae]KAE9079657.1 hypothetical protein PF006_g27472 [Phytophthora fragariae]
MQKDKLQGEDEPTKDGLQDEGEPKEEDELQRRAMCTELVRSNK